MLFGSKVVAATLILVATFGSDPFDPSKRLAKAKKEIRTARNDYWRLYPLGEAGMACVDLGQLERAREYADQLLDLSERLYPARRARIPDSRIALVTDPFGQAAASVKITREGDADAIHKANIILGRIDLRRGDIDSAKSHLLKAGDVEGSPVLESFGPNMALAKELLEIGERDTVLAYFKLCGTFWKFHTERTLQRWIQEVSAGGKPDFGANLYY